MKKYRKKPIIIEAIQFKPTRNNRCKWPKCIKPWTIDKQPRDMSWGYIETLEGNHHVLADDWIIEGIKGEFYLCKPDIFKATYEEVKK